MLTTYLESSKQRTKNPEKPSNLSPRETECEIVVIIILSHKNEIKQRKWTRKWREHTDSVIPMPAPK